jgi:hypothetical protein
VTRVGSSRDDNSQAPSGGSSAVSINIGGPTLAVIVVLAGVIGACGVVMGLNLSEQAALGREFQRDTAATNEKLQDLQRQYRMTELKLDDWTVVAHRSGLVLPDDYTRGPQGDPDAKSFNIKPKGK